MFDYCTTIFVPRFCKNFPLKLHNLRQFAERAAVNMPIQGTAADIMKLAMIRVHHYLQHECEGGCLMLLQVHDGLLFEIEEARLTAIAPHIVTRMESTFPLSVRLRADAKVGRNWAKMESYPRKDTN